MYIDNLGFETSYILILNTHREHLHQMFPLKCAIRRGNCHQKNHKNTFGDICTIIVTKS